MGCFGCPYAEAIDKIAPRFVAVEPVIHKAMQIRLAVAERMNGRNGGVSYIEAMDAVEGSLVGTAYFVSGQRFWWRLSLKDGTPLGITYSYCDTPIHDRCNSQH